jgi:hypothetical protein
MGLTLFIGNKNYSSWSMRPWIAMKVAGIPFQEEVISLDAQDFKARMTKVSGTGKVPVLVDGEIRVWESLAILGLSRRELPGGQAVAGGREGARSHPRDCRRDACWLCAPAATLPDEHAATADASRANAGGERRRSPHRIYLDRLSHALRCRRAILVRQLRRCRRDVCAGRLTLRDLRDRRWSHGAGVYAGGAGTAGLAGVARGGN